MSMGWAPGSRSSARTRPSCACSPWISSTKSGLRWAISMSWLNLGRPGGEMRMSELAAQAYSSRSGMTRRIDRLGDEGLVTRANSEADGRGVVVALTEAGVRRLAEAAPIHLRQVNELFVARLSDAELSTLASALDKVAVDCTFG